MKLSKISQLCVVNPDDLSLYIRSLKLFNKQKKIKNDELIELVTSLPAPEKLKEFSNAECGVLYETANYLWKAITGKEINDQIKTQTAKETLMGNYWLLNNGILLSGINHFSIIKQNSHLVNSLLDIGQMLIQQYLSLSPNHLIFLVIKNGGVRLFVNKDKKMFAQMNEKTYADWGRAKIKKYNFKDKLVKIIDLDSDYEGWKSGVGVVL